MTQTDHADQRHCHVDLTTPALSRLGLSAAELDVLRHAGYLEQDRRRNQQVYWRLRFRHDGRQRTLYLGADPELVAGVRAELLALQTEHRRRMRLARVVRCSKKRLRVLKTQLAQFVAGIGFHYHGDQLRKRRLGAMTKRVA